MSLNKPYLIGITGGIGSGKSTVCKIFQTLGVPIYDADSSAKRLIDTNADLQQSIISLLGEEAYQDGTYNRTFVAKQVFSNPEKLARLNAIIHPAVGKDFKDWAANQNAKYVMKEAALLFESGSATELDKIILITAPEDMRVNRVLLRDPHRTPESIHAIISKQWPEERKAEKSDYIISNDEARLVIPQVLKIHTAILKLAEG
ncbi:MAG: dephospho-CoA kinase [Cyclobacteriaceae bacterium]